MELSHSDFDAGSGKKAPLLRRLSGRIRALYLREWASYRTHYKTYVKIAARALAVGFILGFAYFAFRPDQEKRALALVWRALRDIPLGAPPLVLALVLFYHNARASVIAVAAGWIPFVCLPVLDPLLNGAVLGLVVSVAKHQGQNVPRLVLTSLLPHAVFELPAVVYATGVGLYLSVAVGRRLVAARRNKKMTVGETRPASGTDGFLESYAVHPAEESESLAIAVARSFLLVVLPLLLVAAFIEAFITPRLG